MSKRGGMVALVGLIALCVPLGDRATGAAICLLDTSSCPGKLLVSQEIRVAPDALPKSVYAPAAWHAFGKVKTSTGTHPPALRQIEVDIDKDVKVSVKGYPVCRAEARLDVRDPSAAMKACGDSVIGKGLVHVKIAFPEREPLLVESPLTIFNGGEQDGRVKLYFHIIITVPGPSAVVATATITRKGSGLHSVATVPVIANGSGSLIGFKLELGETYFYKGRKVGIFKARCPNEVFKVRVTKLLFRNEARTPGEGASTQLRGSLAIPCSGVS